MTIDLEELQFLRRKQGVYFLYKDEKIVYIGQSSDMYVRLLEHTVEGKKDFDCFKAYEIMNKTFLEVLEVKFINRFNPVYNKLVVDNFESWFNTLPKICKIEMAKDDITLLYKTNSMSILQDFIYNDILKSKKNSLLKYTNESSF